MKNHKLLIVSVAEKAEFSPSRSFDSLDQQLKSLFYFRCCELLTTRDVFYVRRVVDLMNTAKVNAYIMYTFEKIEPLSIHAT